MIHCLPRQRAVDRGQGNVILRLEGCLMKKTSFSVRTSRRFEILSITRQVGEALSRLSAGEGICTVFTPHTTAAVSINEDADPDVRSDLALAFEKLVPGVAFSHAEGNSDSHLLSTLVGVSLQIPFSRSQLELGRWQGIYFLEFDGPRTREVRVYVLEG